MLKKSTMLIITVCLLVVQVSCGPSQEEIRGTESAYQAATQAILDTRATRQALFTANAQATVRVEQTVQAQRTLKVQQTSAAVDTTATAEAESVDMANTTGTAESIATSTAEVIRQRTATANAINRATAQAQPMFDLVTQLVNAGDLSTDQGEFFELIDFDFSWAQLGWYQGFPTGFSPTDFVVQAHAEWDSASKTPDPWSTGCGFMFRTEDGSNHYLTFLGLDGNVYFSRYYRGVYALIGSDYYGEVGIPEGAADIALAVEGTWITFLVNGERVLRSQDSVMPSGSLNYTVISGTNKDYGTHCRMTNVELWVIR